MKNTLCVALLFVLALLKFNVHATHMIGGELTYKWMGGKKYQVLAKFYRDCRGIPFESPDLSVFTFDSSGSKRNISLNAVRISIEDISAFCSDTLKPPCKPVNSPSSAGVEVHTYQATVDFDQSPYNGLLSYGCKMYLQGNQCCRNGAITTLNASSFYMESMLDLCHSTYKNSSPQFTEFNQLNVICNQPYRQNFGAFDVEDHDSLAYELVAPLNDHNSPESYSGFFQADYPMTPYCPPNPGVVNCRPLINQNPPRGFYFNNTNGDIIFTPTKCDEIGVICMKVKEYRKDSTGQWRQIGFVTRDLMLILKSITNYKNYQPRLTVQDNYTFQTRKESCFDIVSFDTLVSGYDTNNRGDVTTIRVLNQLPGMDFQYLDSTASNKTARLCWKPHDSLFLSLRNPSKKVPVTLELQDNFCPYPLFVRKTVFLTVRPPDSSGYLKMNTYFDRNKNQKMDNNEKGMQARLRFKDKYSNYYVSTDGAGLFADSIARGTYTIGPAPLPLYEFQGKDTVLKVTIDSNYNLSFGLYRKSGIYGRIYRDLNNNCKFDLIDEPLKGLKIFTDSNKYMGISNSEGLYYIQVPNGSYNLHCNYPQKQLTVNCPSSKTIAVNVTKDSAYENNDFGISLNPNYTDVACGIAVNAMRRGYNSKISVYCVNHGPQERYNVKLTMPLPAYLNISGTAGSGYGGTKFTFTIDTLKPFETKEFYFTAPISPGFFSSNMKVCLSVSTDSTTRAGDSVKTNNYSSICRTVDAPFDPNEKIEREPGTKTVLDNSVDFSIHFQNTGTDTAVRIIVVDTIDTKYLDPAGFELNWSDAPCDVYIEGNVLTFIFEDIKLPHLSAAGDKSIAGFNFSLGLKTGFTSEQLFENKASIYFDYEAPIHTKPAQVPILSHVRIDGVQATALCQGQRNGISFTSRVPINPGNIYSVEMSDQNGSFANPVTLGSKSSSALSDSIQVIVPPNLKGKFMFRIRTTDPPMASIGSSGFIDYQTLPLPTFNVSTNANNDNICEKDTLKLTCSNSAYQYKLLRNGVALTNFAYTAFYKLTVNLNEQFKIIALDNSTLQQCKDTIDIPLVINPKPILTLKVKGSRTAFCNNDILTLAGTGATTYQFFRADTAISSKSAVDTVPTPLKYSAWYQLFGESDKGCRNIAPALHLVANTPPVINTSASPKQLCPGDSFSLSFSGGIYYDVLRNDTALITKTTKPFKTSPRTQQDRFNVIGIDSRGCFNKSKDADLLIYLVPGIPVITKTNNTLTASATGVSSYKWYRNDTLLSNTGNTVEHAKSGTYKVIAYNSLDCYTSSDLFIFSRNTSINNVAHNAGFIVYPNPANNSVRVECESGELFIVTIYDASGRVVRHVENLHGTALIPLDGLIEGMYFYSITSALGTEEGKLIVQH